MERLRHRPLESVCKEGLEVDRLRRVLESLRKSWHVSASGRLVDESLNALQFLRLRLRRGRLAGRRAGSVVGSGQRVIVGQSGPPDDAGLPRLADLALARLQVIR